MPKITSVEITLLVNDVPVESLQREQFGQAIDRKVVVHTDCGHQYEWAGRSWMRAPVAGEPSTFQCHTGADTESENGQHPKRKARTGRVANTQPLN
jgi:hypothetical protein